MKAEILINGGGPTVFHNKRMANMDRNTLS